MPELLKRPDPPSNWMMFTDFDGWERRQKESGWDGAEDFRRSFLMSPDPEQEKIVTANQKIALEEYKLDINNVVDNWDVVRPQLASKLFGLEGEVNDSQLHAKFRELAVKEQRKDELRRNLDLLQNPDPGEWEGFLNSLQQGILSLGEAGQALRAQGSLELESYFDAKAKKSEQDLEFRRQIFDKDDPDLIEREESLRRSLQAKEETAKLVSKDALGIASTEEAREAFPRTRVVDEFMSSPTIDWESFKSNWFEITSSIIAESLPISAPSLAAGVVTGPAGVGAGSFLTDTSLGVISAMRTQGVDMQDAESIEAFFRDPERINAAWNEAAKHGVPVAALDAISFGVAGKMVGATKGAWKKVAAGLAEMGVQSALGGGGELLGQLAQKGEVENWTEVFAEAVGEMGTGVVEIGFGLAKQQAAARAQAPNSAKYLDGIHELNSKVEPVFQNADGTFTVAETPEPVTGVVEIKPEDGGETFAPGTLYSITRKDGTVTTGLSYQEAKAASIEEIGKVAEKATTPESAAETFTVTEKQGIAASPVSPAFNFVKKNFRSRGDLPQDAFDAKNENEAINNSIKKEVEFNVKRLEGAIREEIGLAVTPAKLKGKRKLLRDANEVMAGARSLETLPESMRDTVSSMRRQIDNLSRKLITNGVVQGDLQLVVKEGLGSYLNRSYRVYDDPNWAKNVPAEIRNTAIGFLRKQNPIRENESRGDYDSRIIGLINEFLYDRESSPIEILARGKIGSKNLKILKNRKNIPPEIRALMGEYEGVIQNYAKSVFKISTLLSNSRFLESVKESGTGVYLFKEPDEIFYAKISAKGNPALSPLDGLYTTEEIQEAFTQQFSPAVVSGLAKLYFSLNGFAKYGKVVLSPITQVRNFTSNIFYSIALGNVPFKGGGVAMRVNMQDVLPDFLLAYDPKRAEFQEAHKKYTRLGLLNESVTAGDFAGLLKDAFAGDMDLAKFSENLVLKASKNSIDVATKLYQAGDGFWKIANFEAEKGKLLKAFPDRTEASIEKEAAKIVRDMTPTYSLVPPAIQKLRRFPLLGPFVSFSSEVVRNNIKISQRIMYELSTPELKGIGAKRLAGFISGHALAQAIVALGRSLTGTSDEEEDAIRTLAAPWDANANILMLSRDEHNHIRFINLSYVDPFSMFKKPFIALSKSGDIEQKAAEALGEIFAPFLGEELLSKALLDISRNRSSVSGGKLWNPQESLDSKISKMAAHLAKAIEPGFIAAGKRVYKAATKEEGPWGDVYHLGDEIIANTTGNRIAAIAPETSLLFRSREAASGSIEAVSIFTSLATRPGSVGEKDLAQAYSQMETARERIYLKFKESFDAAVLLGLPVKEAATVARAGGVSKKVIEQDSYIPYKMSPHQLKKLKGNQERIDLIKLVAPESLN